MKGVLVGIVSQIGKVEIFGENGFKKQEVIVKTVDVRGREYTNDSGEYTVFMAINCWKVESV